MDAKRIFHAIRGTYPKKGSWTLQSWAVFWAQTKILVSYLTWLMTEILTVPVSVAIYFFTGLLVRRPLLAEFGYGSDYLAFATLGVATTNFVWVTIVRLSHVIQHEVEDGTLEVVLSSPIRLSAYLAGAAVRGFLFGGIFFVATTTVSVILFNARFRVEPTVLLYSIGLLILTLLANLGIGALAAGVILVYKKGDPIVFLLSATTELLAGVVYPLRLLESYPILQQVSLLLPYTYGLDGIRRLFLTEIPVSSPTITFDIFVLLLFIAILFPMAYFLFKLSYDRIRREGTTATY